MRARVRIGAVLLLAVSMLCACGTLDLGVLTPEPGGDGGDIPEGVVIAREIALMRLREMYGDSAPSEGLLWQGEFIGEEGVSETGRLLFTSSPWTMTIVYPTNEKNQAIYTIDVSNEERGFYWQGRIDAAGVVTVIEPADQVEHVAAWLGHVARLSESGSGLAFILQPDGAGEFEIVGKGETVDEVLADVVDGQGAKEFVHVWGLLTCGVDAYGDCRLVAERVQTGAVVSEAEPVDGWEGVIYTSTQPPGSGGDDYFVLTGEYPIEFGIWSSEEALRTELEGLRDSGTVIRIWGELVVGIPDWGGTQINVQRYELVEANQVSIPPQPTPASEVRGWATYTNERYGYQIQFPPEADLEEMGIHGYQSDEQGNPVGDNIPEGLQPDEVIAYLLDTYGENLCVEIYTTLGYIVISAPENEEFRYANCGRTGVGVGELVSKEETVEIDGQEFVAGGFEIISGDDAMPERSESLRVMLPDGTRIGYGSRLSPEATFEDYLMKGKPVLLEILSTFRSQ